MEWVNFWTRQMAQEVGIHSYMHTYIIHTYVPTYIPTNICLRPCTYVHTYIVNNLTMYYYIVHTTYTYITACINRHTHILVRCTNNSNHIHTHAHAWTHTYIHTYIQIHSHLHRRTYIQTYRRFPHLHPFYSRGTLIHQRYSGTPEVLWYSRGTLILQRYSGAWKGYSENR